MESKKFTQYPALRSLTLKAWGSVLPTQLAATLCEVTSLRQTLSERVFILYLRIKTISDPTSGKCQDTKMGSQSPLRDTTNLSVQEYGYLLAGCQQRAVPIF